MSRRAPAAVGFALAACIAAPAAPAPPQDRPPTPEQHLGHRVGADFELASWPQLVDYFGTLDAASARVQVRELGRSTEGRPFIVVEISSAENLRNRERLMALSRQVADPRRIADEAALRRDAKVVIALACGLHSIEVAASQMAMELAHSLATATDPETLAVLDRCVIVLFPSQNPDGNDKIRDWYRASLGTPWEGGRLPWLYHVHAGHDNNRDWFMLNLPETRLVTRELYFGWAPTIYYDLHQMGNAGARFFVPPFHDPINPNLHPIINQGLQIIGGHMSADLLAAGRTGVVTGAIYDNWWAGGNRTTPQRHNIFALLTEAASCNVASPVFQRKEELTGHRRGLPSYGPAVNFPAPWPGGWWRLRDIVEVQAGSCRSLFTLAARYQDWFLRQQIAMGREQLALGARGAPFAWLVPGVQRDPGVAQHLLRALARTGIEVHVATAPFTADGAEWPAGTRVLHAAQPFRPHLKDMMERQVYPDRAQWPGGPPEAPYDMAGWTLPLQMGVEAVPVVAPFEARAQPYDAEPALPPAFQDVSDATAWYVIANQRNDEVRLLARLARAGVPAWMVTGVSGEPDPLAQPGMVWIPGPATALPGGGRGLAPDRLRALCDGLSVAVQGRTEPPPPATTTFRAWRLPRIGLYQPWTASMDEGWTRLVLETHDLPPVTLHDADLRAGAAALARRVDVVLLPSESPKELLEGLAPDSAPPQYVGGLGREGVMALQEFVEQGGHVVASDAACDLVIEHFQLPVTNVTKGKKPEEFYCAGSILRVVCDARHPLAFGMPERAPAFFTRSQAFSVAKDALPDPERKPPPDVPGVRPAEAARRYRTVAPVHYADTLLLQSGYCHKPEVIAGQAAIVQVTYGAGTVTLLGFRTQHRGQPHGTFRFLFNALLAPGLHSAAIPR